jgi:flagellar motor protein MotB
VLSAGAHLVGDGLNAVGLHGAAQRADTEGTKLGFELGADVPELQLGQTTDPAELVHGDPGAIGQAAARLWVFGSAFKQTAAGLSGIETAHWEGAAADAFRARFAPEPAKWSAAAQATNEAGRALESYAGVVTSAQSQARLAVELWEQGQQATAAATTAYNQRVAAYNSAAQAYNARRAAGQDPRTRPTQAGPFSDPGQALREQAQQVLADARAARDDAAASAAAAVTTATDMAHAEPSFWSQAGDDLADTLQAGSLADISFTAGVLEGTADIVKVARTISPVDPWNEEHPAEYVAGASATLAGLAEAGLNPVDAVKGVFGTGWGSDPAQALGKLVPNVGLVVATDGGAAVDASDAAMFSSGSAVSNAEVVESGAGLARTPVTVENIASRAGVNLKGSTVRIVEDPEYIRYLDSEGACACAPYDLPGEIHLGPASFINEETLAATLAHEQEHVLQYAAGYVPNSGDSEAMEAAAREAEASVVARLVREGK